MTQGIQPGRGSGIVPGRSESGIELKRRAPSHIIVFETTSEAANADVLKRSLGVAESLNRREDIVALDDGSVELYRALGVAVAHLSTEQVQALRAAEAVANVYENGYRYLPPAPPEMEQVARAAASASRSAVEPRGLAGAELIAYLRGQRDAIDNILRVAEAGSFVPSERARISAMSDVSWCLEMMGVTSSTPRGRGITVAVLDTGVRLEHPDLAHHFEDDQQANAQSFVTGESIEDRHGHGTHCCGIVAGSAAPCRGPRYGVAPDVTLLAGKVMNNRGVGRDDEILDGIAWAISRGADVISMSFCTLNPADDQADGMYQTIAEHVRERILMVAAAGNGSRRPDHVAPVAYPAAREHFCAVGAVDHRARIATFSCGGPQLKLVAPGVDVWSSDGLELHGLRSGTSMAAPHVAAAAAIWAETSRKRGVDLLDLLLAKAQYIGGRRDDVGVGLVTV